MSINRFTYFLEMRKQGRMVTGVVCHINKFTYKLEMRRQDRMVRCMVRVKSTSSHTNWNEQTRKNSQRCSLCQIDNFTYCLEM